MHAEVTSKRTRTTVAKTSLRLRAIAFNAAWATVFTLLLSDGQNRRAMAESPSTSVSSVKAPTQGQESYRETHGASHVRSDTEPNIASDTSQPDDIVTANSPPLWEARSLLDRAVHAQRHSTLENARELADNAAHRVLEVRDNSAYEYGVCLAVLGSIDTESYRLADAAKECEAACAIIERFDDESNLLHVLMNLAWVKRRQGSYEASSVWYNSILNRLKNGSHENSPEYILVTLCLGQLSLDRNDVDGAKRYFDDAQCRLSANLSNSDSCNLAMAAAWGRYHLIRKEYSDAERFLHQAVEMGKHSPDVGSDKYLEVSADYAESLVSQARYADAKAVLEDALSQTEANLGADHKQIQDVRKSLAELPRCK